MGKASSKKQARQALAAITEDQARARLALADEQRRADFAAAMKALEAKYQLRLDAHPVTISSQGGLLVVGAQLMIVPAPPGPLGGERSKGEDTPPLSKSASPSLPGEPL